jgi:import inner membrane translocase subunit TIM44
MTFSENVVICKYIKVTSQGGTTVCIANCLLLQVSEIMGGLFQRTELSETLTEILQLDPQFEKEAFLRECEQEIIPNILEAVCRSELDVIT